MTGYRTVFPLLVAALLGAHSVSAGSITFFVAGGDTDLTAGNNVLGTAGALGDALLGFGINVSGVLGNGTPNNDGAGVLCIGCELTFVTGGLTFFDPDPDPTSWIFAGGGGLGVNGHIDLDGDGVVDADEPDGVLLAGLFSDDSFVIDFAGGGPIEGLAFSAIIDAMNPFLTSFFGLPVTQYEGQLVLTFTAARDPNSAGFVSSNIGLGLIVNDIPEPSTTLLIGIGLIGLVGRKRPSF